MEKVIKKKKIVCGLKFSLVNKYKEINGRLNRDVRQCLIGWFAEKVIHKIRYGQETLFLDKSLA